MKERRKFIYWPGHNLLPFFGLLVLGATALAAQEKTLTVDLGGGIKMEFVLIPAGSFKMGSEAWSSDQKPIHRITITQPFYIGKYEVTQEQWQVLMENNPSKFQKPNHPVENVSWDDSREFLWKLGIKMNGFMPRLPTEAEWEYSCRAGSATNYCYGDSPDGLGQYAWYGEGDEGSTHPVGGKKPNAWGLYDMHGNVQEWCSDCYGSYYYGISPKEDPQGAKRDPLDWDCPQRVVRGGAWHDPASGCTSSCRWANPEDFRNSSFGFRVVLQIK